MSSREDELDAALRTIRTLLANDPIPRDKIARIIGELCPVRKKSDAARGEYRCPVCGERSGDPFGKHAGNDDRPCPGTPEWVANCEFDHPHPDHPLRPSGLLGGRARRGCRG